MALFLDLMKTGNRFNKSAVRDGKCQKFLKKYLWSGFESVTTRPQAWVKKEWK
jgi:hypothetical protein